jgi:hypothetical protein
MKEKCNYLASENIILKYNKIPIKKMQMHLFYIINFSIIENFRFGF